MKQQYATLVHEWFEEVWNLRNPGAIDRLLDAGVVVHGISDATGQPVRGPKEFKAFYQRFPTAFPDLAVEVLDTISEGDRIAARCVVRGTHKGDGLGFAATGNKTEFSGMCIVRVNNGKFIEGWNNFDFLAMYSQLRSLDKLNQPPPA